MTGIRLSRQVQRDLDLTLRSDAEDLHEDEQGSARTLMSELDGIGDVPQGSLEEAIWCELGALPKSRRATRQQ